MTRIAIDTNVLIYSEGIDDARRRDIAMNTLSELSGHQIIVPVQVLGEIVRVLIGRARWPIDLAIKTVERIERAVELAQTDAETWALAKEIVRVHRLQLWDSIILAAASQAGCAVLLSEDYQDGFAWRGTTVVNPFAEPAHPLLVSLMNSKARP